MILGMVGFLIVTYRIGDHIGKYTYFINFSSGDVDIDRDYDYRTLGFSVRAVTD